MPDAGLRSGGRKLCRRQPIDAIVELGAMLRPACAMPARWIT